MHIQLDAGASRYTIPRFNVAEEDQQELQVSVSQEVTAESPAANEHLEGWITNALRSGQLRLV